MPSFYKPSGIVPIGGLIQLLCAGLGTAMSVGIVYAYASYWIPFVYAHVVLTAAFGLGLGMLVNHATRSGRVRNRVLPAVIGFLSGLIGLYFAWAADMHARARFPWDVGSFIVLRPSVLFPYIEWFYQNGGWRLGNHGQNLAGLPLAGIWLAEAAVIVGGATWFPWSEVRQWVFCEHCGWWQTIETNVNSLSAANADSIAERLNQGDVSVLREIPAANPHDIAFLHLNLAYCETCDESNYVDLDLTTVTFDKKGAPKHKKRRLVEKLMIAAADVPLVRAAGAPPTPDATAGSNGTSIFGDAV